MKITNLLPVLAIALSVTNAAYAHTNHSDANKAANNTAKTRTVNYSCQNGKKLSVKYGFNRQNLPTYAQANLNGKARFMPINLNISDNSTTVFGDENNFRLMSNPITAKTLKNSSMNVQSPSDVILFKGCQAR